MRHPATRFLICSTLLTLGCGLTLLGVAWLMFLGLALMALGALIPLLSQRVGRLLLASFLIFAALAVVQLSSDLRHERAFIQERPPLVIQVVLIGGWLGAIVGEVRHWWKSRI